MMSVKVAWYAEKEDALMKALQGLEDGTYTSLREASCATGTPRKTLGDRFNGGLSHHEAQVNKQSLSPDEEAALVSWIDRLSCTGNPVHHQFLHELALEIRRPHLESEHLPPQPLGKHWVSRFLNRNPLLQSRLASSIEGARKAITEEQIQDWFANFQRVVDENNILPENIYNMDETSDTISSDNN